jgi:DNA-directed RNA polymerase subunit K/omega
MADELRARDDSEAPDTPAPQIHSRFLFVDVAARRAVQLKRGARPRVPLGDHDRLPRKVERIAMEEVRQGRVYYQLPDSAVS